ncbi:MAG: hypothetical protein ACK4TP_10195 [Hyphomicrobium sp.]
MQENPTRSVPAPDISAIPDWVQPGASFSAGRSVWHVRVLIDEGAVCRRWMNRLQRWQYEHLDPEWFAVWKGQIKQRPTPR